MLQPFRLFISKLLLMVMIGTFFSPSIGLAMTAAHGQHGHAESDAMRDDDHERHHEQIPHEHHEAHASIGHLLTHLQADLSGDIRFAFEPQAEPALPALQFTLPRSVYEPPYRPPKSALLA